MLYSIVGQRDTRWATHLLGNSHDSTIGGYGCLLVDFALLCGVDPLAMNDWMIAHGGYQAEPRGGYAATFDVSGYNGRVKLLEVNQSYHDAIVSSGVLSPLVKSITQATPCILMVNHIPGVTGVSSHYVLAIDVSADGQVIILDPWFGDIASFNRYGANYGVSICEFMRYSVGAAPAHPLVTFTATPAAVKPGDVVTLSWSVEGVSGVWLDGKPEAGVMTRTRNPSATTTYVLTVQYNDGVNESFNRTVTVTQAPPPPTTYTPLLGANVINNHRGVQRAYDQGMRFFTALAGQMMLVEFKAAHPDCIVVHRELGNNWTLSGQKMSDRIGGSNNGVIYMCYNENDNFGYGTAKELSDRINYELDFVRLMRAKGAKVAFGSWSVGCPDITQQNIVDQLKRLAPVYNSDPGVYVDQHLYSPNPRHIYSDDIVWYERRWEFLFTKCGFDPKAGRKVISTETGLDEGGIGGFPAHGLGADDFVSWCNQWQAIQAAPLVVGGVSYPSPFLGAAIFAYTEGTDPRWQSYDISQYMQAAANRVKWA